MKTNYFLKIVYLSCILLFITTTAFTKSSELSVYVLHDSLGEVIDARENALYNIFGEIEGFSAARIYKTGIDRYQLHILRNLEGKAQILITDMSLTTLTYTFAYHIKTRRRLLLDKGMKFEKAIYPIEESMWYERSDNKKITLRDGSKIIAVLKQAKRDILIVQTLAGIEIFLPDITIAKVTDLKGEIAGGKHYSLDPNQSRLFFSPTGRPLQKGDGYFADYFLFFPTIAYGMTDFFSMGGGVSLIPGADSQILYFTPKLTFKVAPKAGIGTGFLFLGTFPLPVPCAGIKGKEHKIILNIPPHFFHIFNIFISKFLYIQFLFTENCKVGRDQIKEKET